MKKTIKDFKVDKTIALKNGKGLTTVLNFLDEDEFSGKGRLFGISIIEVGGSIGYHKHVGDQEGYYILEGKGKYIDNGEEYEVVPGDFMLCKEGDCHSLENIGDIDLKYIALILYTN